jgi:prefoldin subunit 5
MSEARRFEQSVTDNLQRITELSSELEENLEALPKSVAAFDTTIRELSTLVQTQQSTLRISIDTLGSNIDDFAAGLESYEARLAQITDASDRQLLLLKRTQASWEAEMARTPNLKVLCERREREIGADSSRIRVWIRMVNRGNRAVDRVDLLLRVPKELCFRSPGWDVYDSSQAIQQWHFLYNNFVMYSSDTAVVPVMRPHNSDFTISIPPSQKNNALQLECTFYHSIGSQVDTLVIPLNP